MLIYTQSKFSDFISSLKDEYIAGGFYNVQIDSNIDVDMQNRIGIELNVNQGKRATINSMAISICFKTLVLMSMLSMILVSDLNLPI